MEWARAIVKGTLTGVVSGVTLLIALNIGIPNYDEFLVVLPIMAIELVLLYAASLTIIYLPIAALFRAAGRPTLVRIAGFILWPTPLLLLRLVGALFNINKRPNLSSDVGFLLNNLGLAVPLFAGLAIAGVVFAMAAARVPVTDTQASSA